MKRFLLVVLASTVSTSAFAMPILDWTIPTLRGGHLLHYVDLGMESIPTGTATSTSSATAATAVAPVAASFAVATPFTRTASPSVLPMMNTASASFYVNTYLPGLFWTPSLGHMFIDLNRQIVDKSKPTGGETTSGPTIATQAEPTVSVPEPGTLGLMLLTGLVFLLQRRRLSA